MDYEFTIRINGTGETKEEAWNSALEGYIEEVMKNKSHAVAVPGDDDTRVLN